MPPRRMDLLCHLDLVSQGVHAVLLQPNHVCIDLCKLSSLLRLTGVVTRLGLAQQKAVKITAVICVLAYIAMIAVIYGHCTPVRKNWQVYPYPGGKFVSFFLNLVKSEN